MQHKQLLKTIIKSILTEAPYDVWKKNNTTEDLDKAKKYFTDLTGRYKAFLHPTVTDLTRLSFGQIEKIHQTIEKGKEKNLELSAIKDLTKKAKEDPGLNIDQVVGELSTVPEAQLGKIAEKNGWVLYMPHNTEASCEIGKTGGRRDTSWCTTVPDEKNLFTQYIQNKNVFLFYVVKKGVSAEKDPFAKMSIGFKDGKVNFGKEHISVDAKNNRLTRKKFEQVLGKDLANEFLSIMKEKYDSSKGIHPLNQEIYNVLRDPIALKEKLDSFKDQSSKQKFLDSLVAGLSIYGASPDALLVLAKEDDPNIRSHVAENENTPVEALLMLAADRRYRFIVAKNKKLPPDVLTSFIEDDPSDFLKILVAQHPNTSPETLTVLTTDKSAIVRTVAIAALEQRTLTEAVIFHKVIAKLSKLI